MTINPGKAVDGRDIDVGEMLVAAMAEGGIDHLFFTSGTELAFYQEAIAKRRAHGLPAPRLILMTHEYPCLNAALGYAAVTGRPAVTSAHVDVGTLHHGGAIHTAWRSGLPVLMTAGAPPTSMRASVPGGRNAPHFWLQDTLDQNVIVRPYTKWDHRLQSQDHPGLVVSRALQIASTQPCGPVYLSMPREVLRMAAPNEAYPSRDQLCVPRPAGPDPLAIKDLARRLVAAGNPIVVSGCGINPAAITALVELCESLALPVVQPASISYMGFPFGHDLYQSTRSLADADLVLSIAAEVPWMPASGPSRDAYVAVIDSDPIKVAIPMYEFYASQRITSDPLLAIQALTTEVERLQTEDDTKRIQARAQKWAESSRSRRNAVAEEARSHAQASPIHSNWLSHCIAELVDDNAIVMDDTTHNKITPFLKLSRPGSYFHNPGSCGGWAPGAALGAKLAAPKRDVVAVTGDGFYLYANAASAIWSAAKYNAPYLTVVYQNRSYTTGTIALDQTYPGGYAAQSGYEGGYLEPAVDFGKEAEAAGGYGETVRDPADLPAALRRGLDRVRGGQPAVISVWLERLISND
jgi:acetolactate synthase-1/2/3 large subunit